MKSLGITNQSAYLRAMVLNGYILKLDLRQIQELIRMVKHLSNNVNQIAKRLNANGSIYETEVDEILEGQKEIWAKTLQSIMGHSDIQTTLNTYAHSRDDIAGQAWRPALCSIQAENRIERK